MGRPKGSKNKPKEDKVDNQPKLSLTSEIMKASKKTTKTFEKVTTKQTKDSFEALANLALVAATEYVVAKVTQFAAPLTYHSMKVEYDDKLKLTEFILLDADGEKVDSIHVFDADIEFEVRQFFE